MRYQRMRPNINRRVDFAALDPIDKRARGSMTVAGQRLCRSYRVQSLRAGLLSPHGLNDMTDVVGEGLRAGGVRAVLLRCGVETDLGTLGGSFSSARGIN